MNNQNKRKGVEKMKNKTDCSYGQCSNRVGLFLVILFALCFLWYYLRPVEQELHLRFLRMAYLGFDEMNFFSFILAAIQTYIWAYIAVGIWWLVGCCKPKNLEK